MTSYERIRATLDRRPLDRLACDMWATDETVTQLMVRRGVESERALYEGLGVDKILWVKAPYRDLPPIPAGIEKVDEWGVQYRTVAYDRGTYLETAFSPLASLDSLEQYEAFAWPSDNRFDYDALAVTVRQNLGQPIMLSFISLFEVYTALRGFENALTDLYIQKDLAHFALERICDIQLAYIEKSLDAAGEGIDIVYFSDDMGMQDRQLFGTDIWDEFIGQRAERIIDLVHRCGKKVFYHTDGSAPEIVDRLVSMGIDILNPIQYVCPGMERERLKQLYGKRVIFHGAIENQRVLPFGSPEDVRRETEECMRILGAGGGYIVASCHNLQPNTPVENILAMYEAVHKAGAKYL